MSRSKGPFTAAWLGEVASLALLAGAPAGAAHAQAAAQAEIGTQVEPGRAEAAAIPIADTPGEPRDPAAEDGDIVVTARRRGENLAKVPAVVAAFSGEQLEQRGILQQSDLQAAVPGLVVRQTQSSNNLNYVIRGQSVDAFSGSATAIVPYVNEVQFAPGGASSFFDLESVQVLKGPQGTLFGRNATGGAVLVTTARPVDRLAASAKLSLGNYHYLNAGGMLNLPVVDDRVLLRAAFDATSRRGFQRNVFDGRHLGRLDRQVGRLSLVLRPSDAVSNTSVVQVERSGGSNTSSIIYSAYQCGEADPSGRPLTCTAAALFGPQLDRTIGVPGAWATYLNAHPGANPGGINAALDRQQRQLGFRQVDESNRTDHRGRNAFLTNTTTFALGGSTELKNIFGWSRSRNSNLAGQLGVPFLILASYNALVGPPRLGSNSNDERVKTISEELQLQGKLMDDRLTYVAGGYLARTRSRSFFPATYTDLSPIFPLLDGVSTSLSDYKQQDSQQAFYAQVAYDLGGLGADGLTLNAGYRHSWEQIESDQLRRSRFFGQPQLKVRYDKPSWLVGLDYKVSPSLLVYAQTRGSWRTGGINGIAPPVRALPAQGGSLFLPETTEDYEIGAKFNGDIGARRGHLYIAAYRQDVKNIQRAQLVNVPIGGGLTQPLNLTISVPSARVKGAEADFGIDLADWLSVGATGAFTDAAYRRNQLVVFGQAYRFGPYGDAPRWSGNLNAQVRLPVPPRIGGIALRVDIYGQTGFYFSNTAATRSPRTRLTGYSLVNLRADWTDLLGHTGLGAGLFLRNAFQKGYHTGGFALGDLLGVNSATVGEPRIFGAELKYSF